jgi:hypothetical protein
MAALFAVAFPPASAAESGSRGDAGHHRQRRAAGAPAHRDAALVFDAGSQVLFRRPRRLVQLLLPRHGEIQRSCRALPGGRGFFSMPAARPVVAGACALAGNAATAGPGYPYRHAGSLFEVTSGNSDWLSRAGGASCGYD